jgi:lipopolysaccharide export system permease protein
MKLIDRHILRSFLLALFYILISMLGLFLIYDISSKTARFLKHDVPFVDIVRFYSLYVPQLIALALPMVILMAIVLGIGRISKNNEITAMRACGVSILRVARPLFITGLLLAAGSFLVFEKLVTKTFGETKRFEQELKGNKPVKDIIHGGYFLTDLSGSLLRFEVYRPGYRRFERIFWKNQSNDPRGRITVKADRAVWMEDAWWAFGVNVVYPNGVYSPLLPKMKMYEWDFRPEDVTGETSPEEMSIGELRMNIRKFRISPEKVRQLRIQFHRRIVLPLLNLIVIGVALPFAVKGGTRGGNVAVGVGVCMLLCLAYYGLSVLLSLFRFIPPWIAIWTPNVLFGFGGLTATLRMD